MPMNHNRVLAIKTSHIPTLKDALSVILDAAKPTHRLEIFSRVCGYRTWASLKAELDLATHSPVALYTHMRRPDPFILEQPQPVRRRMVSIGLANFLTTVEAGMDLAWDGDFGDVGLDPSVDLDAILARREAIAKSRDATPFSIDGGVPHALLVSPKNRLDIINGARELRGLEPIADPGLGWAGTLITPDRYGLFHHDIRHEDVVEAAPDAPEPLAELMRHPSVVFSHADMEALQAIKVSCTSLYGLAFCDLLEPHAAEIDGRELMKMDGGPCLFTHGYYGAAHIGVPYDLDAIDAALALQWLGEISNLVHAYLYEYDKDPDRFAGAPFPVNVSFNR